MFLKSLTADGRIREKMIAKRISAFILIIIAGLMLYVCTEPGSSAPESTPGSRPTGKPPAGSHTDIPGIDNLPIPQPTPVPNESGGGENAITNISITVNGSVFSAKLYDNNPARAFLAQLPITLNMSDLNRNEKYCYMPEGFPAASERVEGIRAGDLMLYGSDCVVLFYESFSTSYSYTRLGFVKDSAGLADALGSGNIQVLFTANE